MYENRAKGNEPLAWQHRNAQAMIDRNIEISEKSNNGEPAQVGLDLFFASLEEG